MKAAAQVELDKNRALLALMRAAQASDEDFADFERKVFKPVV